MVLFADVNQLEGKTVFSNRAIMQRNCLQERPAFFYHVLNTLDLDERS